MKIKLLLAILLLATPLYAQRSVRKKPVTAQQNMFDIQQVQKLLGKQLKDFVNITSNYQLPEGLLERDVLGYYKLHDKYDSPLKIKMFKQSSEYEALANKLEKERDKLLADTFYIVKKVPKTNYDLAQHSFTFYVPQTNISQTIINNHTNNNYSYTFINCGSFNISTPLLKDDGLEIKIYDENDALDIENHYNDCRLVYVFTVNEEKTKKTGLGSHVICDMQNIYFVDIKKQKVYYSAETGLVLKKYAQYEKDIYASYKMTEGYVMPTNYYLKKDGKYIEIQQDELDDYMYEESEGHYYVYGMDDKKYQLTFQPEIAAIREKDEAYFKKCEEVKKDYLAHPERYKDVTIIDKLTKESTGSYIDHTGCEWVLQSENFGLYQLERENVYILFDELRFIQKKK